ncbi:MAG: hypothetical protein MUE51_11770 [Thermoleophilia bacterium]|jgi:hypothetical protein|nr:hypothetical protein [Thermoleophilia bacterium]
MPDDEPQNDAFSVVSGVIRTPDGEHHPVEVLTPTVFGSGGSLTDAVFGTQHMGGLPMSGSVAGAETVDGALALLHQEHPGAEWVEWPAIREADDEERARALAEGVNDRYLATMGMGPLAPKPSDTPRRGLLRRLFGG